MLPGDFPKRARAAAPIAQRSFISFIGMIGASGATSGTTFPTRRSKCFPATSPKSRERPRDLYSAHS
jgi:hypothetical protein